MSVMGTYFAIRSAMNPAKLRLLFFPNPTTEIDLAYF